jgi:fatty acid amide hydrolase 2
MATATTTSALLERSATDLAGSIRSGELTSREVVEAHIERIERVNPRINAVVAERFDDARADADAADERASDGAELAPLHGVPCTVKESLAFEGLPNAAGLVSRGEHRPAQSSTVVERIRVAGAIPLGVTNTSELTLWVETENRLYGRTSNPYDQARTAGGSSGGEGAIVGSGGSPFGLGTDFGGSIRLPAFFNGVFGHKPTAGLVPLTGHDPSVEGDSAPFAVCGPLARRAEDLMPALRAIAGPDGSDPIVEDVQLHDPADVTLAGMRVLVSESATLAPTTPQLAAARERAAGALAAAGAKVESLRMRSMLRALEIYLATIGAAAEITLEQLLSDAGVERLDTRALLRRGGPHTVATRVAVIAERLAARAPERRSRKVLAARDAWIKELCDTIGDGVLLHPPAPNVAPKHGRTVGRLWWIQPMLVFNLAGLPATQVPLGLNDKGLPLGVQVAAGPGRDHTSIAVALELERVFGGWVPPPL